MITGLGNLILKTPFVYKIKDLYPHASIHVVTDSIPMIEFVFSKDTIIDSVYQIDESLSVMQKIKLLSNIREHVFDAIFAPFDVLTKDTFVGLFFVKGEKYIHFNLHYNEKKYGFKQKIKDFLLKNVCLNTRVVPLLQGRHEIDLNYDLLEFFHNRPMEREYATSVAYFSDSQVLCDNNIESKKYIVIQPFGANGGPSSKIWDPDNFKRLVYEISLTFQDLEVILVGDQGDLSVFENSSLNGISNVINLIGKTTLNQVANIVKSSLLVISHDSGIMHLSNALDVNLIVLIGPTDYIRTGPISNNSYVVYSKNCLADSYNFGYYSDEWSLDKQYKKHYCMSGITIDMVMKVINKVISY